MAYHSSGSSSSGSVAVVTGFFLSFVDMGAMMDGKVREEWLNLYLNLPSLSTTQAYSPLSLPF